MQSISQGTQRVKLPLALYPTAAQERIADGLLADMFQLDVREVRAMNAFMHDLLISRAIEGGYIKSDWTPKAHGLAATLDELSKAIFGHWSKLLTQVERDERRHVLFVLRILKRQFASTQLKAYHV